MVFGKEKTILLKKEYEKCIDCRVVGLFAMYYEDGARIEAAFRNFIHRADAKQEEDSYEIFVCHANVIRYIVCS
ncbi:serine threonine-protein phosphatase mitochondrial isoform x2 [Limosa lapponica baueri]|uniref:Serine threonine-protein phosphatase mitochondrial isoform x2 n=1 Tax=Limosa lapponica baueri TaxID=1758121 RepID=A0A2I0U9C9_LIMLA|nr:serine threonine-protein phosphatase mitochondrial isoform x2 [Limosa lapponica baueri]